MIEAEGFTIRVLPVWRWLLGTYLEFIGKPGSELLTERLESKTKKFVLLNVKEVEHEEGNLTKATVFIPNW